MDNQLPDDFDPYEGMQVNYGVQNGNGANAIFKWVSGTAGLCVVGILSYLFVDNASIRKEATGDRQLLTEQLTLIRERLIAIETKQQTGCKP